MKIERAAIGPFGTNCYLLSENGRSDCAVIDAPPGAAEQIVPALRETEDGGVSEVVELDTPNGKFYVLLKRIAFREAGVIPLKDVREQIENRLRSEHVRRVREEKMAELRDEYHIRYY